MNKREEFTENLKVKIDEWNKDIDNLEEKIKKLMRKQKISTIN